MSKPKKPKAKAPKKWTIMIYFASDNPLAPTIVSQLKAIKDAGFHPQANVLAYYDPNTRNTPSHIFEVNLVNRLKAGNRPRIGFEANDPFIRNLVLDKLWSTEPEDMQARERIQQSLNPKRRDGRPRHKFIEYDPPTPPPEFSSEQPPAKSLAGFLDFCWTEYPAQHYMLLILGHGLVVGNDIFLLDENTRGTGTGSPANANPPTGAKPNDATQAPATQGLGQVPEDHALSLKTLGDILREFTTKKIGKKLDLIGFHSCSMSGLEVAYEIQDSAHYMLASQGPAFVGSWPYKQMLIRVFNDLGGAPARGATRGRKAVSDGEDGLKGMFKRIFSYCAFNSFDFQLAGYSFDVALCDLSKLEDPKAEKDITARLKALTAALTDGLADDFVKGLILLAHWDAQSFWLEQYIDLYDFCRCLNARFDLYKNVTSPPPVVSTIRDACDDMIAALEAGKGRRDDRLIVRSSFVGPAYQYSHGLSVYFPWAVPDDGSFLNRYKGYKFAHGTADGKVGEEDHTGWFSFLDQYFKATIRATRSEEEGIAKGLKGAAPDKGPLDASLLELLQGIANSAFSGDGQLGKKGPDDPTGDVCDCPSIKNYPGFTRALHKEGAPEYEPDNNVQLNLQEAGPFKV
jgi:hypothetical protein